MKRALVAAIAAATLAGASPVSALPPCSGANCHSAGDWVWNKQAAQSALITSGMDINGKHYAVSSAVCYGIGHVQWADKGPEFKQFHCAVRVIDYTGKTYSPYGFTLYVRGHYAWAWGR